MHPSDEPISLDVAIHLPDGPTLGGILSIPENAIGVVLFAHGSGSGRLSPRNAFVAHALNRHGIATLLVDLLTEDEDAVYETRFDIALLGRRLAAIVTWLREQPDTHALPIGLFGASTGAAAALAVAAHLPDAIRAVVSRGGRPDLSMADLPDVIAPTLLIVGGNDDVVIELNQSAYDRLRCEKQMIVIPGATHLFEEPGTLEQVAETAAKWFVGHLAPNDQRDSSRR